MTSATRRISVLAGALAIALGVLSGCSTDSEEPPPGAPSAPSAADVRPAEMPVQWTAAAPAGAVRQGALRSWTYGGNLVVIGAKTVAAYDLKNGKQAWQTRLPKGARRVCAAAQRPNRAGVGALVLSGTQACGVVAALDLRKGTWRWRHPIAPLGKGVPDVSVSAKAVAAVGKCHEVYRFGVVEGRRLRSAAPANDACANDAALLGNVIAVKLDAGTNYRKVGKGLLSPQEGVANIQVLSNDDLRRRWRMQVDRQGAAVGGVLSTDPLVLDTSQTGHRFLYAFDNAGKATHSIGWALPADHGFTTLGLESGVLLGDYGSRDTARYAYDLASGNLLWTEHDDQVTRTLGLRDGAVIRERRVDDEIWLAAHPLDPKKGQVSDPAANAESTILGRVRAGGLPAWTFAGPSAVMYADRKLTAYTLPKSGEEVPALPGAAVAWKDGDVQPAAIPGACRYVSAATLTRFGMRSAKLPAPADCVWREKFEPTYVERELAATVRVVEPTADTSAAEAAVTVAETTRSEMATDGLDLKAVKGLGEEAWWASAPSSDGTRTATGLVVRWRNVVVSVSGRQTALLEERYADLATPDAIDAATRAAAVDILTRIGEKTRAVKLGKDGPIRKAPNVCRALGPHVRPLAKKATATVTTPSKRSRLTGCYWARLNNVYPYVTISAYAVPPSPVTGESAKATAAAIFAGDEEDQPVKGLGDEADVWGFRQQKGAVGTQILTVRKGNLLVTVRYGDRRSDSELRSVAADLARQVIAAAE